MRLEESIALITGAGRGIGRAIALTLSREGATVLLNARTKAELDAVKAEVEAQGGKAAVLPGDLTKGSDVISIFKKIDDEFGRIDILVNNAGIGRFAAVRELSLDDFDAMWRINLRALFQCTQYALRRMESQKSGIIVNISSLAGKNAFIGGAGYAATKWALIGFSRCLMLEAREHNVKVVAICPGSVDTSFSLKQDPSRAAKILSPQDVADTVLMAVTMPPRALVSEIDIRPTNPK